jgi:hypothetical protein
MDMRVSIKLTSDAAAQLQGHASATDATRVLLDRTGEAGVTLEPMHPGVDDDELRTWYYADVDDERTDEVLDRLRHDEAIEAAYVKPPESLP